MTILMLRLRELVTDPAWQAEQEGTEEEKLARFARRLLEWDRLSKSLPK